MEPRPTLFCLHALGSSARAFDSLRDQLRDRLHVIGIDLPGFGEAPISVGTSVLAMAEHVEAVVRRSEASRWGLLGHSMGGKVAAVVVGRAHDGSNHLRGPEALVLLAPSPLSPEPMTDERRARMLSWTRDGRSITQKHAREFIAANTASPLAEPAASLMVADVRRSAPQAWTDWLTHGSREDWSHAFAPQSLPTLVLTGGQDADLDAAAQRELTLPHWSDAELREIQSTGHLLPWERPHDVARALRAFWP